MRRGDEMNDRRRPAAATGAVAVLNGVPIDVLLLPDKHLRAYKQLRTTYRELLNASTEAGLDLDAFEEELNQRRVERALLGAVLAATLFALDVTSS